MSQSLKTFKAVVTWREEREVTFQAPTLADANLKARKDWETRQLLPWESGKTEKAKLSSVEEVTTGEAKR